MLEINQEIIDKAKQAKSVEELITLAKEYDFELTEEDAAEYFEALNQKTGELSDEELENVAGGSENQDDILGAYEPYHMCNLWEGKREDIKEGIGCFDCKHSKKSGSRSYICLLPNR